MSDWTHPNIGGKTVAGPIPIRNLWWLYLQALDLGAFVGHWDAAIDGAADWPHLLVDLFTTIVERRLRRGVSRGYVERRADLSRVRGRLDLLATAAGRTLERGVVVCRFEELTHDTPRNRYARQTLDLVPRLAVARDLNDRARSLSHRLGLLGVTVTATTAFAPNRETYGRSDAEDRLMIELARLVRDLAHPSERAGTRRLPSPVRDDVALRAIFERAVGNFLRKRLAGSAWRVKTHEQLAWGAAGMSEALASILPGMEVDIALENTAEERRIVVDTKFAPILRTGRYEREVLKSSHLYQLYAYLRTQEARGGSHERAEGVLLHPSVGRDLDETLGLHGHRMRFVTVDLTADRPAIEERLLSLIHPMHGG